MADGIVISGTSGFGDGIDALIARVEAATREAALKSGHLIEGNAKKNFEGNHVKGEPHVGGNKPNTVSGTLKRSIVTLGFPTGPGSWEVRVAPTTVYGRRIELGFSGADSLGRVYDQPPFPYFTPGYESALPIIPRIFEDAWGKAMGGV